MTRPLPRFEATDALFKRAHAAARLLAEQADDDDARAGPWRSLRLQRLEGVADDQPLPEATAEAVAAAVAPPPLAVITPEVPPEPEDLQSLLSEAVDLPGDWAVTVDKAGGTPLAHCLREILAALEWTGAARQVAEALPVGAGPLDPAGTLSVLRRLGYTGRSVKARLNQLGPDDFPCLFLSRDGNAYVLPAYDHQAFDAFEGKMRVRRPLPRDATPGTALVLRPMDTVPDLEVPASPLALVWRQVKPRAATMATVLALHNLLGLAGPVLLMIAIDHAIPSGSFPMILFFTGAAGLALIAETVVRLLGDGWLYGRLAPVAGGLAHQALEQLLSLGPNALRDASPGWRRAREADLAAGGVNAVLRLVGLWSRLVSAIVALIAIAVMAGPQVAAPLAVIAVMALVGMLLRPRLRARLTGFRRERGRFAALWSDLAAGRGGILSAGCREVAGERLARISGRAVTAGAETAAETRRAEAIASWLAGAGFAATAAWSGWLAAEGLASPGALAAGLVLTWSVLRTCAWALGAETMASRLWLVLEQLRRLTALRSERKPEAPSAPPRRLSGRVAVNGLRTARGIGIEAALGGIDLTAEPGDVVAVVGDCQSGKSALLQVLAGLLPAAGGQARLDGIETARFDPVQLRQSVAYVPEAPEFLPLSIEDNLRLMNPVANEMDLQRACALAGIMEDVRVLETGFGGSRRFAMDVNMADVVARPPNAGFLKRLALARGYARDAGLYLLDGPERYLDRDGEMALLGAIETLRGNATVFVATDREDLIRLADKVVWLDGGHLRAAGDADSMLARLYDEGLLGQTSAAP